MEVKSINIELDDGVVITLSIKDAKKLYKKLEE